MSKAITFLQKIYCWRRLEGLEISKPFFFLTGDIDSTILAVDKMELLEANLKVARAHGVPYWIFITPEPAENLEGICNRIKRWGGEVILGSHGFKHVNFSGLSYGEQVEHLQKSRRAFEKIGIKVRVVQTPYLSLNKYTYQAISNLGFKFDFSTSFGFQATKLSLLRQPKKLKETIFIPLTSPSDTYFRDRKIPWREMASTWITRTDTLLAKGGALSFLVHPAEYEENPAALEALLDHVCQTDASMISAKNLEELLGR